MAQFELVELDPMTGEEDQLIATGTFRRLHTMLDEMMADLAEDWDNGQASWPAWRIQPAS